MCRYLGAELGEGLLIQVGLFVHSGFVPELKVKKRRVLTRLPAQVNMYACKKNCIDFFFFVLNLQLLFYCFYFKAMQKKTTLFKSLFINFFTYKADVQY